MIEPTGLDWTLVNRQANRIARLEEGLRGLAARWDQASCSHDHGAVDAIEILLKEADGTPR